MWNVGIVTTELLLFAQTANEAITSTAPTLNVSTNWLFGVVLGLLVTAFVVGRVLRRQPETFINPAVVRTFNQRVVSWWTMCAILIAGFILGRVVTVMLFGFVSFWAMREYVTMTPTRRGDHRALFWTFFILMPLQYVLVGFDVYIYWNYLQYHSREIQPAIFLGIDTSKPESLGYFYGLYSILIPVYASLFIPARIAFAGDHKRFLERTAKIQAGLLICVYALSHAPALLSLQLVTSNKVAWGRHAGEPEAFLFYFVLVAQLGDVFTYLWGKLLGRHPIAPAINASKTWEGLIGGALSTMIVGTVLSWATPFQPWEAACMSLIVALMGFAGSMTMSAIKRDRGVRDYGTLVTGHAGVLDRIDSICFAAPIFFHLTRYFFTQGT